MQIKELKKFNKKKQVKELVALMKNGETHYIKHMAENLLHELTKEFEKKLNDKIQSSKA